MSHIATSGSLLWESNYPADVDTRAGGERWSHCIDKVDVSWESCRNCDPMHIFFYAFISIMHICFTLFFLSLVKEVIPATAFYWHEWGWHLSMRNWPSQIAWNFEVHS